jgi:myosin light chain 6
MSIDSEAAKKVMAIYDWNAKGVLDMFYFMDIFYALGFNITKKACVAHGQQEYEEKKYILFDDVVGLMNLAIKEPDNSGNYHDYVELCKLYDKNENGTMMLAELQTVLSVMGDEIPKEDVEKLLEELADKEDEDGFFPYTPFLDRLCGKA